MDRRNAVHTLDIAAYLDTPDVLPAGKLCLEFANTAEWHASVNPHETISNYAQLIAWAERTGICSQPTTNALRTQAAQQPHLANQVYAWAIELREAIYSIFAAIANQQTPTASDLALINEALSRAYTMPEIAIAPETSTATYGIHWRGDDSGLDAILWPIMRSVANLLTASEHDRIGQCADDRGCGYLFFDTSRNHSRRWCDMKICGNRAKSQRHYARYKNSDNNIERVT